MNENLNLVEILKDCPKGTKLYSTVFGEVKFNKINITSWNPICITLERDGKVHEYSAREVQQFCEMHGMTAVNQLYYGTAHNLYPHIINDEDYGENFINELANDKEFFMEMNSPDCVNQVPHEGIVIKKEDGIAHAWKLKTFAFMNWEQKELDKGIENVEDNS